ncbi:hypothetical protein NDU88_007030 [Pleurodeles waltl]|uniref:Uncharacterized protein n=1 Tax=Pleurodeles waltl TaxID=8319 RepID=A0AAV7PKL9_PLEWA|nr:hypothetical protein NDU88_007030 [Pleurodeles waltl]
MQAPHRSWELRRRLREWSRGLEHPATQDGGLLPDRDPGGTAGSKLEDTPLGNPDCRVPITEMTTACPWRAEEDARNQEEDDDAGNPKGRPTQEEKKRRSRRPEKQESEKDKNPTRIGANCGS